MLWIQSLRCLDESRNKTANSELYRHWVSNFFASISTGLCESVIDLDGSKNKTANSELFERCFLNYSTRISTSFSELLCEQNFMSKMITATSNRNRAIIVTTSIISLHSQASNSVEQLSGLVALKALTSTGNCKGHSQWAGPLYGVVGAAPTVIVADEEFSSN